MSFLIEQQAIFETNQIKFQERQAIFDTRQDRFQEALERMEKQAETDRAETRALIEESHRQNQELIKRFITSQMELSSHIARAVETALDVSAKALIKTDQLETRVTVLENPKI